MPIMPFNARFVWFATEIPSERDVVLEKRNMLADGSVKKNSNTHSPNSGVRLSFTRKSPHSFNRSYYDLSAIESALDI